MRIPKPVLSVVGIVLVALLAVGYIHQAVLKNPILSDSTVIRVSLDRTGGLFEGSRVSYRGQVVGEVQAMALTSSGVEAVVKLETGVQIPRGSTARVRSLSPVGEQFLDFSPQSTDGPYLQTGDVVAAGSVDLPQSMAGAAASLVKVLEAVRPRSLRTLLSEAGQALDGNEDSIQQLFQSSASLNASLRGQLPMLKTLLRQGNVVLRTGVDTADEFRRFTASFKEFSGWLRRFDPEMFRYLREQPGQIATIRTLVQDLVLTVPNLLDQAVPLAEFVAAREPALRELLIKYPQSTEALTTLIRNERFHVALIIRETQTCDYDVRERGPRDLAPRGLYDGGHCSPSLTETHQRGAQFAPGAGE